LIVLLLSACHSKRVSTTDSFSNNKNSDDSKPSFGIDGNLVALRGSESILLLGTSTSGGCYEYYSWPFEMYLDDAESEIELNYANLMYTDYQTKSKVFLCNTPGCRHNTDNCTSFIAYSSGLEIVTNSTGTILYLIATGGGSVNTEEKHMGTIWSANPDGSGREVLFRLQPNEMFMGGQIFADQSSLYLRVQIVDPVSRDIKVELRVFNTLTRSSQKILELERGCLPNSTYKNYIFLETLGGEDRIEIYRYSFETNDMTKVYTYVVPDPINWPYCILESKYFYITQCDEINDIGTLSVVDLMDGSIRTVSDIPAFRGGSPALSDIHHDLVQWGFANWDTGLEYKYFVDLENRTFWERTLTFYDPYSDCQRFVDIIAKTGDMFLVLYGYTDSTITFYNLDGIRYQYEYYQQMYALIDKDDFYNNIPNYQPVTDYTS